MYKTLQVYTFNYKVVVIQVDTNFEKLTIHLWSWIQQIVLFVKLPLKIDTESDWGTPVLMSIYIVHSFKLNV